jgi:hypothetical protein
MNDLLKLISGGENEGLEFKESPRLKEEILSLIPEPGKIDLEK